MNRKEVAETLKAYEETLEFSSNEKVIEAMLFAIAVLEANIGEYEYAVFSWNLENSEYERFGRAMPSEVLARNRFAENVKSGWIGNCYDTSRIVVKRRKVTTFIGEWEELS